MRRSLAVLLIALMAAAVSSCSTDESQQDQLVGMWKTNGWGTYVALNDDGTYGKGSTPVQAIAMDPFFERGTWTIEEGLLTFTASEDSKYCSGVIGAFEVEITDDGDEVLVTLIEDSCDERAEDFPSGLTRHTDT